MAKSPLKDKDFIPDDDSLQKILGNRWARYSECLEELKKRNLYPEMYWYGPSVRWRKCEPLPPVAAAKPQSGMPPWLAITCTQ